MKVYVLTNPEDGWDCVIGVFLTIEAAARKYFGEDFTEGLTDKEYRKLFDKYRTIIHEKTIIE